MFSGHIQALPFILFNVIDIINVFKFQNHKLFEKFYPFDFQVFLFSSGIQDHLF